MATGKLPDGQDTSLTTMDKQPLSDSDVIRAIDLLPKSQSVSMIDAYNALKNKHTISKDSFPLLYLDWYHRVREESELELIYKTLGL